VNIHVSDSRLEFASRTRKFAESSSNRDTMKGAVPLSSIAAAVRIDLAASSLSKMMLSAAICFWSWILTIHSFQIHLTRFSAPAAPVRLEGAC